MNNLSQQAIQEFKQIYQTETGKTIHDEYAQKLGMKLLKLLQVIYRPIPKDWIDQSIKT